MKLSEYRSKIRAVKAEFMATAPCKVGDQVIAKTFNWDNPEWIVASVKQILIGESDKHPFLYVLVRMDGRGEHNNTFTSVELKPH